MLSKKPWKLFINFIIIKIVKLSAIRQIISKDKFQIYTISIFLKTNKKNSHKKYNSAMSFPKWYAK